MSNSIEGFQATPKPPQCEFSKSTVTFAVENGADNYAEIEPLYRSHYGEYQARLEGRSIPVGQYDPRLDIYGDYWRKGNLLNFIARKDGQPVGYANIYITTDMHNGDLIAQEDAIYVLPGHRDGTGKKLAKFIMDELKGRGVKRFHIQAVTDPRVALVWRRMGFRDVGMMMNYVF